jgi:hypothetical protein
MPRYLRFLEKLVLQEVAFEYSYQNSKGKEVVGLDVLR